jgi:hypothetical protein
MGGSRRVSSTPIAGSAHPSKGLPMWSIRGLNMMLAIAFAAGVGSSAVPSTAQAAGTKPCTATARGALWTFNGQTGVAYKVIGIRTSCPLGISWLARMTKQKGPKVKGPPGWTCAAKRPSGACTMKGGGIFQWQPKLRPL